MIRKATRMDFNSFCYDNAIYLVDSFTPDNIYDTNAELTKYFYADCYLKHRLDCLLDEESTKNVMFYLN